MHDPAATAPQAPARWVLDTHVVMDWLVFRHPLGLALGQQIESGQVLWLTSDRLLTEFEWVLSRRLHRRYGSDPLAAQIAWRRYAHVCATPPPAPAALRCTDRSDQVFIDLALDTGAQALISQDRAVLALRRPAQRVGLHIAPLHRALTRDRLTPAGLRPGGSSP